MRSRRLFDGAQIELGILPIVEATGGAFTLSADGGTYSYSGNNANLIYTPAGAFTLSADGGTYSYSGNNADLRFNRVLLADGGIFGMFVGLSFISLFEIIELFIEVMLLTFRVPFISNFLKTFDLLLLSPIVSP